ncbi:gamma-glutamyl hydrolase A isoform X1 [Hydra vulgaris]|uniref:gamma-glutamyl hydrolase A isoform X1 n=1 Tax=Hydra vulgaris TaxID=6087 RepID=UPI0002B4126B|nr:gamma-glutamyl hydrolase A [Hydra vulgaris]
MITNRLFLSTCLLLVVCHSIATKLNLRPVVGIISQRTNRELEIILGYNTTYIAASYVKFLEMAGAQVVPIVSSWNKLQIKRVMKKVNGVLFPGGAAPFNESNYWNAAKIAFEVAKDLNDKGIYYPIFGICLGFEVLHELTAGEKLLTNYNAENYSIPVNFTKIAFHSRLFANMGKKLIKGLQFDNITINMHEQGISPDVYIKNIKINKMFRILSTNFDRNGKEFVSSMEGKKYPFYGTQWHPEKNIFEWTEIENINHSPTAIHASQHIANFFVNEARKNNNHFASISDLQRHLIFHYQIIWSGGLTKFEQIYIFRDESALKRKSVHKRIGI